MPGGELGDSGCHGRIYEDIEIIEASFAHQLAKIVDELLCPTDCEGWNDDVALLRMKCFGHDSHEFIDSIGEVLMLTDTASFYPTS